MELAVHQDKILDSIQKFKQAEKSRASDAATTRNEIGKLTELTGVHPKAFAMIRQLDKASDERREDILRSFDELRNILEPAWNGQTTPDLLDDTPVKDAVDADAEPEKPAEKPKAAKPKAKAKAEAKPEGDPGLAADAADFEEQAKPTATVTPINFGGGKA